MRPKKHEATSEEVEVRTLDRMRLATLRLLKVDVEGMEIEVLGGAREIIKNFRPYLYIECDRKDRSAELITLIKELGYDVWRYYAPLFNPDNFAAKKDDIFGNLGSTNLLCAPKEIGFQVPGLKPVQDPKEFRP